METAISGFVLGAIIGSFIKALADRSLKNKSFWGRSYCENCKHKLNWYDLIPIISFIIIRGKCRYCRKKISPEYLIIEVVVGLLTGFLFWQYFQKFPISVIIEGSIFSFPVLTSLLDLLFKVFFISVLTALFLTDMKEMLIPDRIVLPAILVSFFYQISITLYKIGYLYYSLNQTILGRKLLPPFSDYFQRHALIIAEPLFGSILMAILIGGFFMSLIIITKGKGMGGGDVKLGILMGLALGFPYSLAALVLAFFSGAVAAVILLFARKKHFGQSIAFGPFLVLGSLLILFSGDLIISWYLGDRKSTRLNSSHSAKSRMPSSA